MPATAAAIVLWPVLDEAARRGVDVGRLLEDAAISPDLRAQPSARVPYDAIERVWELLDERCADRDLGLHAADAGPPGAFGLVDHLARAGATLRDAITAGIRFMALLYDGCRLTLDDDGPHACLSVEDRARGGVMPRQVAEYTLLNLCRFAGAAATRPLALVEVRFQHARPASTAEHERLFRGRPLRFEQATNQLVFPAAQLAEPLRRADQQLHVLLSTYAQREAAELPAAASLEERARRQLAEALAAGGAVTLPALAQRLRLRPRTLQRQLGAAGTSHQALLDEVRHHRALQLLEDPALSLAEIAFRLGLSDASALVRAFRRWRGTSPGAWRERSIVPARRDNGSATAPP